MLHASDATLRRAADRQLLVVLVMRDHTWRWSADDRTLPRDLRGVAFGDRSLLEALPAAGDEEPVELPLSGSYRFLRAIVAVVVIGGAMASTGWFVLGPHIAEALAR